MPLAPRALALGLALAAVPQAPRTALGRCTVGPDPAERHGLPASLIEVSGLAAGPGRVLLTHGDERGTVTVIAPDSNTIVRQIDLKGVPHDDFEGIAASGDSVALMTSTGRLYLFRLGPASPVDYTVVETGLGRLCELEGLAWDRRAGTLLLPCKVGKLPVTRGGLVVFRYALKPGSPSSRNVVVSPSALAAAVGLAEVRPTSVEIDGATGDLVILSSKPPMLIETDSAGRILAFRHLASKHHPQAEGVTLTDDALWIVDEGGGGRKGTITKYTCRRAG